jgi:hypothetical protein
MYVVSTGKSTFYIRNPTDQLTVTCYTVYTLKLIMMEDSSSDDDSVHDGNPVVIGRRTNTRYTNWRNRHDALSQIDAAYINDLQLYQESNNNCIQISILILYTICIKIQSIPSNNLDDVQIQQLEKLKLILILCFLQMVIQIMNATLIEEQFKALLNVYEGDRRLENFSLDEIDHLKF